MKTTLYVCLFAITLAVAQNRQDLTPVAGSWEGDLEGVKAVTVNLREPDRQPVGNIVFYILKDEGSGFHTGSASPALQMGGLRRKGDVLQFWVRGSSGQPLSFVMRITGPGHARLTRLKSRSTPELTIALRRQTEN